MDIHRLIADAEQGHHGAVHLIVGAERFFVDRAVEALRLAALGGDDIGFNEEVFHGKSGNARRIVEAARTLPMMANTRFVLVRGVDQLAAAEAEMLADYLQEPSPTTCLVMAGDKLDGRQKLAKLAKKHKVLCESPPLKPSGLRSFVSAECKRRGLSLKPDAAAALVDAVGADLPALDDALERLSLYVGESSTIGLDAVEACISRVRVESIWALVDAVGMRDRKTALKAAASLLADREPPLRILAMVARQLRIVARMRSALVGGMNPAEATRAAGAPPFKSRELTSAAKRFKPDQLTRAFTVLAEADVALKGSKRPPSTVLEGAILSLTG